MYAVFAPGIRNAVMAGFLIGYMHYDLCHYAIHHANWDIRYFRELKAYHMQHHYKNGQVGMGISHKFWDVVFGTDVKEKDRKID